MSEQEQKANDEAVAAQAESAAEHENAAVQERAHGRGVAWLALLAAIAAGGASYVVWQQLAQQRADASRERQNLAAQLASIDTAQKVMAGEIDQTGAAVDALKTEQQNLTQALTDLNDRLGRGREGWVLAEADYLLQVANRRVQLEQDVAGAEAALAAADQRLASLGDPLLTPVRAKISDELQALRAVPRVDVDGISLELGAMTRAVDTLTIAGAPKPLQAEAAEAPAKGGWRGFLGSLWSDMKSLVTIRRHEAGKLPLMTPDQRMLLRQNLRLKLETARLALLRGHGATYHAALQEADQWVVQYFEAEAPGTQALHDGLTRLAAIDIAPALPALDESLRALREASQRLGGREKAAKGGRP